MSDRGNLAAIAVGLGVTVTLLGGGILAASTDPATAGTNDVTTHAGGNECGPVVDDLTTEYFTVTGLGSRRGPQ